MDGPFYYHRALIPTPTDADDYAVDLVLSEIKNSIIRKNIKPPMEQEAAERSLARTFKDKSRTMEYVSRQIVTSI